MIAADAAASLCIITTRYQPNNTIKGNSPRCSAAGSISTVAFKWIIPPVLNWTSGLPDSVVNCSFVCQKLVVTRSLVPPANSNVPPPLHVLFVKVAMSASSPHCRIETLV